MRVDSLGLFWEDYSSQQTGKRERVRPPIPITNWQRPKTLPNLAAARVLAIDTETYDPQLLTRGPGNVRPGVDGEAHDGHICGVSIATDDASWYFPLRHPESDNFDESRFYAWARKELGRDAQPKVGANLMYDVGWLRAYDVDVRGPLYDVQCAEPLLDEEALTYSLDTLMEKYLGRGKDTNVLYEWCAAAFGGQPNEDQRKNIWQCPASIVGPYAEEDARGPLELIRLQFAELKKQDLLDLYKLETSLLPLLIDMRMRGVRVDVERAEIVKGELEKEYEAAQVELDAMVGFSVNVNSGISIAEGFDHLGLYYTKSRRSQKPSFRKAWLKEQGHPFARNILEVRKLRKASDTFVDSYIIGQHVNGRIHSQLHPLRTDANGTVSGRFAASLPNLQNIPKRDERMGPLIRGLFLPDEGAPYWRRFDYSQIEYRLLAHFASGRGSEEVRAAYRNNPKIDFHQMVTDLVYEITQQMLQREMTKNINFGLVYGMALATLRAYLGITAAEAERLFTAYHQGAPFVQHTYNHFMNEAHGLGYITTILKRRRRFIWYESAVSGVQGPVMKRAEARTAYGHIKPAGTHKALNAELQGSAADMIKQAMADAYYAGVFDVVGVPHMQVHDELGFSDFNTPETEEAFAELTNIMETCVRLRVPVKVDYSRGENWSKCK